MVFKFFSLTLRRVSLTHTITGLGGVFSDLFLIWSESTHLDRDTLSK